MKKYAFLLFAPAVSFAQTRYDNPLGATATIPDLVRIILSVVVKVGVPFAVIFIVWSGFLFLTAQGNEAKITKARATLMWTLIGVGVLFGAWAFSSGLLDTLRSFTS